MKAEFPQPGQPRPAPVNPAETRARDETAASDAVLIRAVHDGTVGALRAALGPGATVDQRFPIVGGCDDGHTVDRSGQPGSVGGGTGVGSALLRRRARPRSHCRPNRAATAAA